MPNFKRFILFIVSLYLGYLLGLFLGGCGDNTKPEPYVPEPCETHDDCPYDVETDTYYGLCGVDDFCHYICFDDQHCPPEQICWYGIWSDFGTCWDRPWPENKEKPPRD